MTRAGYRRDGTRGLRIPPKLSEMTKAEACKALGYKSYDTALPQGWFEMMHAKLKDKFPDNSHPWSHFVWVYEDKDGSYLGGKPGAISDIGRQML